MLSDIKFKNIEHKLEGALVGLKAHSLTKDQARKLHESINRLESQIIGSTTGTK